jgi:hypothetical protein
LPDWKTLGEAAVGRELKTEKRQGVEHYVVGQHHVEIEPQEDPNVRVATFSFCSPMGVVLMPIVKVGDGEWEPGLPVYRLVGIGMDFGLRPVPPCFELSDEAKEIITKAEAEARG